MRPHLKVYVPLIIHTLPYSLNITLWRHSCHLVTAIKHPVPYRVKPSFVIFFTSGHSDAHSSASECPDVNSITNDGLTRYGTGSIIAVTRWRQWASAGLHT